MIHDDIPIILEAWHYIIKVTNMNEEVISECFNWCAKNSVCN